jgi:AcrR family transcriptional regulator
VNTASLPTNVTPSIREQKKQAARAEILAVARGLIESKGYHSTRMREIAKAARISYQTLYNYFPAKSLIVRALLDGQRRDGDTSRPAPGTFVPLAALTGAGPARGSSVLDNDCHRLRSVIERALGAAAERQRGLWREVVLDALRQPTNDYVALTLLVPDGPEQLFETVRSAQADGILVEDCNAQTLAQLICRVVDSNLLQLLVQASLSRREMARVLTEQLEMLLQPYLTDSANAPAANSNAP